MQDGLVQEAKRLFGDDLAQDEPLSRHCSFGIGGPASLFLSARRVHALREALDFCRRTSLPLFVLGRGTNLLVPDSGFSGMVIRVRAGAVRFNDEKVIAQAGASLSGVARAAAKKSLSGMEFCSGIPGSVGGAAIMNAGAHGESIGSLIEKVAAIEGSGEEAIFHKGDLCFGYRESNLKGYPGIVTEVTLRLREGQPAAIWGKMARHLAARRATQPTRARCAGSVFKNPAAGPAGKLIELAGAKGMHRGGAIVSRKHANFIVNSGGASYSDVKRLMEDVRNRVLKVHRVELELEIIDLGENT